MKRSIRNFFRNKILVFFFVFFFSLFFNCTPEKEQENLIHSVVQNDTLQEDFILVEENQLNDQLSNKIQ
jgi:hypothetical protein